MRLFFALACPAPSAEHIIEWRNDLALGGKPVSAANLHLTLTFVGQQPKQSLSKLLEIGAAINAAPFTLRLDQLGIWPDGLLHLAPANPPRELLDLASQLQNGLQLNGIELEHGEFHPHLTLARNCRQPVSAAPANFGWNVREFTLFHSQSRPAGVHYQALASWALHLPD